MPDSTKGDPMSSDMLGPTGPGALADYPARLVDTPAGSLACRMAGTGRSPTIVLLHGIGSGSGSWVGQLRDLGDRFHLVAWDAPGYGDSPIGNLPETPTASDYSAALAGLLDALEIDRALLVGQSLGAIMATRFAVERPQRVAGLLLAAPARGYGFLSAAQQDQRQRERIDRYVALGAVAHAAERAPNMLPPDADPDDLDLAVATMARIGEAGYRRAAHLLATSDILHDVPRLMARTTVLAGGQDRQVPSETCRLIAETVPGGAAFSVLEGAGHAVYFARAAFNAHLSGFADRLGAAP